MDEKCRICRVEFEPKTTKVRVVNGAVHHGCYQAYLIREGESFHYKANRKCSHYTPAEDSSKWAFAHRTWGCPDEGATWPHGFAELLDG